MALPALIGSGEVHSGGPGRWAPGTVGVLYLNGSMAGTVTVTGCDANWGFGRFERGPGFDPFATPFELWSLLMHEDADRRLDRSTAANLAVVENAMDRIRAKLFFPASGEWAKVVQLNIDGQLLEWMEY